MSKETIQLADISIEIIRSARRKSLAVEVGPHGVIARAPSRMSLLSIERFLIKKQDWIARHYNHRPKPPEPLELAHGSTLLYLDQEIELELFVKANNRIQFESQLQEQRLVIAVNGNSQTHIKKKLTTWYKEQAHHHCQQRTAHFADQMQLQTPPIKVREYKRRWGSCDNQGTLSYNWRLIMAPEAVVDYVVIHELAHLLEFNHSKRFWHIVSTQMPDWQQYKHWLNNNGPMLYRF